MSQTKQMKQMKQMRSEKDERKMSNKEKQLSEDKEMRKSRNTTLQRVLFKVKDILVLMVYMYFKVVFNVCCCGLCLKFIVSKRKLFFKGKPDDHFEEKAKLKEAQMNRSEASMKSGKKSMENEGSTMDKLGETLSQFESNEINSLISSTDGGSNEPHDHSFSQYQDQKHPSLKLNRFRQPLTRTVETSETMILKFPSAVSKNKNKDFSDARPLDSVESSHMSLINVLREEKQYLEKEINNLKHFMKNERKEISKAVDSMNKAESAQLYVNQELEHLRYEKKQMRQMEEDVKKMQGKIYDREQKLKNGVEQLETERKDFESNVEQFEQWKNEVNNKHEKLRREEENLKNARENIKQREQKLQKEKEEIKIMKQDLKQKKTDKNMKDSKLEKQINELRMKIKSITKERDELDLMNRNLREKTQRLEKNATMESKDEKFESETFRKLNSKLMEKIKKLENEKKTLVSVEQQQIDILEEMNEKYKEKLNYYQSYIGTVENKSKEGNGSLSKNQLKKKNKEIKELSSKYENILKEKEELDLMNENLRETVKLIEKKEGKEHFENKVLKDLNFKLMDDIKHGRQIK